MYLLLLFFCGAGGGAGGCAGGCLGEPKIKRPAVFHPAIKGLAESINATFTALWPIFPCWC